jgi:hypothetical protein
VKCSIFCFHFYCFSLPNFVGPLLWDKCTNGQIAFIPEKHISGTYFGEHFIDICDVADFGPFSHQLLATPTTQIHDCLHSWHGGGISIKDGGLN